MGIFSSKAQEEIDKLIAENDELKNKLHTVLQKQKSQEDFEEKLSEARQELSDISLEERELETKIRNIESDLDSKTKMVSDLTNNIAEFTEIRETLEATILFHNTELKEAEQRKANFDEENKDILDSLNSNKLLLDDSTETLRVETEKVESLRNDVIELEKNTTLLTETEETLKKDIESKQSEIIELQASNKEFLDTYEEKNSELLELGQRIENLTGQEDEYKEKVEEIASQFSEKELYLKNLSEKISVSEEVKNNLEINLASMVSQVAEKDKLFNEFIIKKEELVSEIHKKQNELSETNSRIEIANNEFEKLDNDKNLVEQKRIGIEEEIKKFESIKNDIQQETLKKREIEEDLNRELDKVKKKITDAENRKFSIEDAQLAVERNFSESLEKFTEELTASQTRVNVLKEEVLNKNKELIESERILSEKSSQIAEYGGLIKVLNKEHSTLERMNKNLKDEQNEIREKILILKERESKQNIYLHELRSDTESILAKKSDLEKELQQIVENCNNNYSDALSKKEQILVELDEVENQYNLKIEDLGKSKEQLYELEEKISKKEVDREKLTAKISQLISIENSLQSKISSLNEKKDLNENETELNDILEKAVGNITEHDSKLSDDDSSDDT